MHLTLTVSYKGNHVAFVFFFFGDQLMLISLSLTTTHFIQVVAAVKSFPLFKG